MPVTTGPYTPLTISGDSPQNGIGDPSLEYSSPTDGWLAYSAVASNATTHALYVSTHVAHTSDNGKTWQFAQAVNQSTDATIGSVAGAWRYEVPALIFDPGDGGKEWKLFYHKYFANRVPTGMMQFGAINYRTAHDPAGTWSAEIPLFGAGAAPLAPFHNTRIDIQTLHPSLASTVSVTEPGIVEISGVLYMSASVLNGKEVILLSSSDHALSWHYVATMLTPADADPLGFAFFDATSISKGASNTHYLLAAPTASNGLRAGTMVFQFADITHGALARDGNRKPILLDFAKIESTARTGGSSDYSQHNTNGGLLIHEVKFGNDSLSSFGIYQTKISLP
jgi:hypothetical protein